MATQRCGGERAFTDMDLARVNLIRDLKDKMGVNDEGLDVVLHLVDQMHALRRALSAALESAHDQWPSFFFKKKKKKKKGGGEKKKNRGA